MEEGEGRRGQEEGKERARRGQGGQGEQVGFLKKKINPLPFLEFLVAHISFSKI
jgi:hypothetical protein